MNNIDRITSSHLNNEVQLLVFNVKDNKDLYALNIFKVKEVIKHTGFFIDFNYHNEYVEGLLSHRDLVIPVLNLKKWFGSFEEKREKQILICDFNNVIIGLIVNDVKRILIKSWSEIERESIDNYSDKIIAYTRYYDNRLVQIVDAERLVYEVFPELEEAKLKEIEDISKVNSNKEVLIADDSKIVLKTMSKILDKLELKYKTFKNGDELLKYLFSVDKDKIGAIITDLEMPVKSGFEVIKSVKNSDYKDIPIIVNSTMSGDSNEDMAKSLNADAFISKSHPKEVERYLQKFLKD